VFRGLALAIPVTVTDQIDALTRSALDGAALADLLAFEEFATGTTFVRGPAEPPDPAKTCPKDVTITASWAWVPAASGARPSSVSRRTAAVAPRGSGAASRSHCRSAAGGHG
jgi:hypothetical protein